MQSRYLPYFIIAAVFVAAVAGGSLFYLNERPMFTPAPAPTGSVGAQPPRFRGPVNAPVHLEEFGDFQCPPCAALAPTLLKIEEEYSGRLRVTFRQFPLNMHKFAAAAARAAEAAGQQGRYWQMHDLLYQNNPAWSKAPDPQVLFEQYAQSAGVDLTEFKKDMAGEKVESRLKADRERATSLGVDRTPVLFLNNRKLPPTSHNPAALRREIDALLPQPKSKGR